MADNKGLKRWLLEHRTSTRLAYLLQFGVRILASLTGLIWVRVLLQVMGKSQYSLFISFQNYVSFGGQGDLGMGGAVAIRAGQYFGQGKEKEGELQRFLGTARSVFLLLAVVAGGVTLLLSPWIRQRVFPDEPEAGSLNLLFVVGSASFFAVILFSYLSNLNYACGNVTWPVVPSFVLLQLCMVAHWWLARQGSPLWIQYLPYVAVTFAGLWLFHFYISVSHPRLAGFRPFLFDPAMAASLFENSFWLYLCTLGNALYKSTDGLVIIKGSKLGIFRKDSLADYQNNYKFCDLVIFLVIVAGYVSMPKITQWISSSDAKEQDRARREILRLNQFQTLLGCGAALAYLAANNLFIKIWMWHAEVQVVPVPTMLQLAFALNLAVTASGEAGIQLALRSGSRGLRLIGIVVALTGLINLGLSYVAMKMGSFVGIAMATVLAQSIYSLVASGYTCRHLRVPWAPWALRGWLMPLAGICVAGWLRTVWPMDSAAHVFLLLASYLIMIILAARLLGVDGKLIRDELAILKKMAGK